MNLIALNFQFDSGHPQMAVKSILAFLDYRPNPVSGINSRHYNHLAYYAFLLCQELFWEISQVNKGGKQDKYSETLNIKDMEIIKCLSKS